VGGGYRFKRVKKGLSPLNIKGEKGQVIIFVGKKPKKRYGLGKIRKREVHTLKLIPCHLKKKREMKRGFGVVIIEETRYRRETEPGGGGRVTGGAKFVSSGEESGSKDQIQ